MHLSSRYLTPDPTILLSDLSETTSKRYNKLNSAIVTLVRKIGAISIIA